MDLPYQKERKKYLWVIQEKFLGEIFHMKVKTQKEISEEICINLYIGNI